MWNVGWGGKTNIYFCGRFHKTDTPTPVCHKRRPAKHAQLEPNNPKVYHAATRRKTFSGYFLLPDAICTLFVHTIVPRPYFYYDDAVKGR